MGDDYQSTRHNIGFDIADALAVSFGKEFETSRYSSIARMKYKGRDLVVFKPSIFMNLSGKAVRYWINKENVQIENILVIVDDISLPLGTLRMNPKGSHGGHNGLLDIIEKVGDINFPRLRFGIGNDFAKGFQVEYVLGKWEKNEKDIVCAKIPKALEMIKSFVTIGIERTMTLFNE